MLVVYVIRYLGPTDIATIDPETLNHWLSLSGAIVVGIDVRTYGPAGDRPPDRSLRLCPGGCCEPMFFPTETEAVAFTMLADGTRPDGRPRYAFSGLSFAVEPAFVGTPVELGN